MNDTVSRKALLEWMDEILSEGSPEVKLGVACVYTVVDKGRFDIPSTESEGEAASKYDTYNLQAEQAEEIESLKAITEQQKEEVEKLKHRDRVVSLASETLGRYVNEGKEEIKVLKRRLERLAETSVDISEHESLKAITELAIKGLKEIEASQYTLSSKVRTTAVSYLNEIERLSQ